VQVIAGDQVLDLATRQADLAIRFFRPTSNQLVAARVGQVNMSIFAAPSYVELVRTCRKSSRTCASTTSSTTRRCTACRP
jgi:DNA-binding transcriptional LysR family regulator